MTDADRPQLQSAVRNAARRASRNPPPGHDLQAEQTEVAMRYLDAQSERIFDALADGESVYGISRWRWRDALLHLLNYRKSVNAAKAA